MYDDPRRWAIFLKFTGLQTFSGIAKLYLNAFSLEVTSLLLKFSYHDTETLAQYSPLTKNAYSAW